MSTPASTTCGVLPPSRRPPARISIGYAGKNAMFCCPRLFGCHRYPTCAMTRYHPASHRAGRLISSLRDTRKRGSPIGYPTRNTARRPTAATPARPAMATGHTARSASDSSRRTAPCHRRAGSVGRLTNQCRRLVNSSAASSRRSGDVTETRQPSDPHTEAAAQGDAAREQQQRNREGVARPHQGRRSHARNRRVFGHVERSAARRAVQLHVR